MFHDVPRPRLLSLRSNLAIGPASMGVCALSLLGCSLDLPEPVTDASDAGPDSGEAGVETGPDSSDAFPEGDHDSLDGDSEAAPDACPPAYKPCVAQCVPVDDPEYGCASAGCEPCALPDATAKCSGGLCSVSQCNTGRADCDGKPDTGCEVELATDEHHCGQCDYDCRGADCSDSHCGFMPVATGVALSWAVEVDDTYAYFTAGGGDHELLRVDKMGGTPEPLTDAPAGEGGLALDATHVYWANMTTKEVSRVLKGGGTTEILGSSTAPLGVVVDDEDVFWVDVTEGAVMRASKTAPNTPLVLASGITHGKLLTMDSEYVYASAITGDLFRIPKGGGAAVQLGTGTGNDLDGWAVAVDSESVYWVSSPNLLKVPIAGGTQTQLGSGLDKVKLMTLDGGQLFVCTYGPPGHLWTISTSGSSPLRSLGEASGCHGVAVDEDFVYITRHQPQAGPDAGVFRVSRPPAGW